MENTIWWIGGVFVLMVLSHGIQTGGYNQGHEDARIKCLTGKYDSLR